MASVELDGGGFLARVSYEVTQDVTLNRSTVGVTRVEVKAASPMASTTVAFLGSVFINGTEAVTMTMGSTYACSVAISSQDYAGGGQDGPHGGWSIGFKSREVTVNHQENGTGEITVTGNISLYHSPSILGGVSGTKTVPLPQIPRTSALTADGVALGQEMVLTLTRASAEFVDTVAWRCGTEAGTIAEKTGQGELRWAVPLALAAQAPEDTRVKVVLTVTTFLGDTQAGSQDTEVYCTIPETVVPTLAVTVEDALGYAPRFGGYVQGQSQARVETTASGPYGASIREIRVQCGKLSGTGGDVRFALEDSGSVPITVTVTDSRGRTASYTAALSVLAYRKPQVTIRAAGRCDEEGNHQPDGAWMKVVFDASVTALTGNTAQYRGSAAVHGGTDSRQVLLTDYTDRFTVTEGSFLLSAGVDTGYDCTVTVQDSFCAVDSAPALVSVAFALLDLCRDTRAVGIGMRAKTAGVLSIGLDTDMDEHRIGNLAAPENDADAATKAYVDACIRQLAQSLGAG